MNTLENQNKNLEIEIGMMKEEQKQILNSYYDLEKRYKDIIHENKQIKNEICDLRRNKSSNGRFDDNMDLPLNKAANYCTPNKVKEQSSFKQDDQQD